MKMSPSLGPQLERGPNYIATLLCRESVDLRPFENLRYRFTCYKTETFSLETSLYLIHP